MLSRICPLYKIPTRNIIKKDIDDKLYYLSVPFKEKLENAENMSVTTDAIEWNVCYGITIHFLNGFTFFSGKFIIITVGTIESFKSSNVINIILGTLGVVDMSQSHTADYIESQFLKTLTFKKKNVLAVVTDNGAIG